MSELLPCPFCGGEHDGSKIAHIDTCFIVMEELNAFDYEDGRTPRYNEEQLREAWNTRAERTCTNSVKYHSENFRCSNCGHIEFRCIECGIEPSDFGYCPNCGAKVVNE